MQLFSAFFSSNIIRCVVCLMILRFPLLDVAIRAFSHIVRPILPSRLRDRSYILSNPHRLSLYVACCILYFEENLFFKCGLPHISVSFRSCANVSSNVTRESWHISIRNHFVAEYIVNAYRQRLFVPRYL